MVWSVMFSFDVTLWTEMLSICSIRPSSWALRSSSTSVSLILSPRKAISSLVSDLWVLALVPVLVLASCSTTIQQISVSTVINSLSLPLHDRYLVVLCISCLILPLESILEPLTMRTQIFHCSASVRLLAEALLASFAFAVSQLVSWVSFLHNSGHLRQQIVGFMWCS